MSEETPDTVYATESQTNSDRVSQRATAWHTEPNCRQLNSVVEIDGAEADRRDLKPCTYCATDGGHDPGTYEKKYAWDLRGMDDTERQALADQITTHD